MKQYLIILLISLGLGGLVASGVESVAADRVPSILEETSVSESAVSSLDEMLLPELTPVEELAVTTLEETPEITKTYTYTYNYSYSTPVSSAAADYYAIAAGTTDIDCGALSNNQVYHYGNLLFAHAYKAFSNLKYFAPGNTFTVSENGVMTTYMVKSVKYFQKTSATTLALCSNGLSDCKGTTQMSRIARASYIDENYISQSYSVALMACAGVNDSHRIVVFADAI